MNIDDLVECIWYFFEVCEECDIGFKFREFLRWDGREVGIVEGGDECVFRDVVCKRLGFKGVDVVVKGDFVCVGVVDGVLGDEEGCCFEVCSRWWGWCGSCRGSEMRGGGRCWGVGVVVDVK